ncbi:MAG: hypothetical protein IJ882_02010 [Paludibacteraceae bacterium]|nr:hypothetical protein [Paludibacteraceae bacterium]
MKNNSIEHSFTFWCPITKAAEKVVDPTTGEDVMVLGGIASTADEDSDGEFLDPKGFDIRPLMESGLVNWHHQAKGQPATIIGEPRVGEIRKEGLYLETILYPSSPIAQDVWQLAQTLEKDSKTRRLGYSIEGKVLKRKSDDPKDPGYKHITKAVITGVAITHMPKNPKTFANIIKGEIDDEGYDEEPETEQEEQGGMNTRRGKALMKESVDKRMKRTTFGKAEVFEMLFKDVPGITIQKASQIYSLINKIAIMNGKKTITEDDIQKAYETLGLEVEPSAESEVSKGCDACGGSQKVLKKANTKAENADENFEEETKKQEEEEEGKTEEETEKGCGGSAKKEIKKAKKAEEQEEEEEVEEEEEEVEESVKKGGVSGNRFDRIEKAIATSHQLNSKSIRAVGILIKGMMNDFHAIAAENAELKELVKGQSEELSELREAINEFGAQVPARKSVTAARVVERQFSKGMDNELGNDGEGAKNPNAVSMSRNPGAVAELLDLATFAKGYDEDFSKACMSFEATKSLPANIIKRLKTEFNVEVVK